MYTLCINLCAFIRDVQGLQNRLFIAGMIVTISLGFFVCRKQSIVISPMDSWIMSR